MSQISNEKSASLETISRINAVEGFHPEESIFSSRAVLTPFQKEAVSPFPFILFTSAFSPPPIPAVR